MPLLPPDSPKVSSDRGPSMRTCLDVLDLAREILAGMDPKHPRFIELRNRRDGLVDRVIVNLIASYPSQ